MLSPDRLLLLQTVARTQSYSAAARELGFTQPAISYQMRCLEREIGTPLTIRAGATMRLTAAGKVLLAHADVVLDAVRTAERELAVLVGRSSGTLKLGAFPSSCATLVPAAISRLSRELPELEVRLLQVEPPQCHELVRRGELELGLSYRFEGPAEPADRLGQPRRIPLFLDEVKLLLPLDHPAARRRLVRLQDLRADNWILAGHRFVDLLERKAAEAGFEPRVTLVADDYVVMQSMAAHGLGITLVPSLALSAHRDDRLVARTLVGWPNRHVQVELWPDQLRVPAVAAMLRALRHSAESNAPVLAQASRVTDTSTPRADEGGPE